jgi:ADP-heptose:LPS heptosyltransferase
MKIPVQEIKKIAVFRALQLGDMLCAIPAIKALHHAYPDAEITLLGMPWAKSLTERFPKYIHSFKHFPGYPGLPEQKLDSKNFTAFLAEVQNERYDLVLQMQGNGSIVNPMVELFGGRYTAGFRLEDDYCADKNLFCIYPSGIHEIERHLHLMNYLGIESKGNELEFPLYKKDYEEYDAAGFSLQSKSYVCVHPGSRGGWRQWPPKYFADLADYCAEQGFTIVMTGTKEEMGIIEEVTHYLNAKPVIAAGKTTVGAAGVLIKNAFALISNCTGVSHMAAAFKTPSLVISMDGEPERWAPLNKDLHHTIDWTRSQDYKLVLEALKNLLHRFLQRDHSGDESVSVSKQHILDGM